MVVFLCADSCKYGLEIAHKMDIFRDKQRGISATTVSATILPLYYSAKFLHNYTKY